MAYWNNQIVESFRDGTSDKAHELMDDKARGLMVRVNEMRKGEAIPQEMRKYYIVKEDDEILLDALQKNLRRVLDTREIWSGKGSIDLTAGSETE